jgi:ubiquinone/menaquinone biosynthesis C-methylase UbiE
MVERMITYLCCPSCLGDFVNNGDHVGCMSCGKVFPVIAGIPDLRLFGPLEGSLQIDTEEALQLYSYENHATFNELVAKNAEMSKERGVRSEKLVDFYTNMSLAAEQREADRLKEFNYIAKKYGVPLQSSEYVLDLGAGMGPALPFLAERYKHVIAVDISLKHLVMARKRCQERRFQNVTFVCACAENLPLKGDFCALVNSTDVLEHVADSMMYLKEVNRVLMQGGIFWASTPNRFTILPEGHVKLWGVGFLPRSLQKSYVRLIRKTGYDGIRPVSYRELARSLSSFFQEFRIVLPIEMHEVLEPHPGVKPSILWTIAKAYWRVMSKFPTLRAIGGFVEKVLYPQFRLIARKR